MQFNRRRDGGDAILQECLGRGRGVALGVLQRARSIDQAETVARRRNSLCSLSSSTMSGSPSSVTTPTLASAERDGYMFCFTNVAPRLAAESRDTLVDDDTEDDASDLDSEYSTQCTFRNRVKCYSQMNSNSYGMQRSLSVFDDSNNKPLVFPKLFSWDWPFCDEEIARGVYTENKLTICLPFNKGGTGETRGSTKKFDKISESNFLWTIGLSSAGDEFFGATCFWRMEIEVIRNLNMLVLVVSRCVTRSQNIKSKRLKRLRKVYRLPDYYDVGTLTSISYDWGIVIEAYRRQKSSGGLARGLERSYSVCRN